jgi:hypothetical protein
MSPLSRLFIGIILIGTLVFLPACGLNNKKMDAEAARHIHTIALLDVSVTHDRVYVDSAAMTMGSMMGGDIGSLAVAVAESVPQSALQKAIPDPAYPSRMLTEELEAALKRKGFTVLRIPDGPPSHRPATPGTGMMNDGMFVKDYSTLPPPTGTDAILDAVCVTFGYQRFDLTQSDHPLMALGARLVSPDGKTVYYVQGLAFTHDSAHQNGCTNIDADRKQFSASWEEVFKDPKRLEDQLRFAARSLADAIAQDLAAGR